MEVKVKRYNVEKIKKRIYDTIKILEGPENSHLREGDNPKINAREEKMNLRLLNMELALAELQDK